MEEPRQSKVSTRALKPGLCNKCKVAKPSVVVKRAEFCSSCFIGSVAHRFRGNLAKSTLPDNSKLMLAFSGGPCSRAMLHTMASYCQLDPDNPRKKRRFPDFCVCYVDQSSLFPDHVSEISKIKSIVESYHRELHIVKLEDVFDEHNATILNRDVATMETGQMIQKSLELMQQDSNEARKHGCTGLVLGDSSTAIAIRVIANTSKGRGLSLPADIGDSDWHRDVHLLRPMRDILSKEIGIFNHLCKLETVAHTSFATLLPTKTSIDRLSQDFIVGLEQDFPATVSTIARTAFKINTDHMTKKICPLCEGPVDNIDYFASIDSLVQAPAVSCKPIGGDATECCSSTQTQSKCCQGAGSTASQLDIYHLLCYACRNIAHDISKPQQSNTSMQTTVLPGYVMRNSSQRLSRESMKAQISDYLIDDDDL
ncbi:hypothetical protein BASA81_014374 [Batrachochytrium salamandrivorans]|nr:hypothetical protein BASA81_014374 [Batrachochytrium salamandrivorans]